MLAQSLLPELDMEMANTRKTLERVPDGKFDFKPHPKSTALGLLAAHLANIPTWASLGIAADHFDMNPPGGTPMKTPQFGTAAEIVAAFDRNLAAARDALANASDELLLSPWSLQSGGHTIFTIPRIAMIRTWVMNHMIHHRSQLAVYLRMNDVPVPSLYGPTADDVAMPA
jgi:uncharacterized damage-inducible protein DinB